MINESNLKGYDIELFTRADIAKLLKIGISTVDMIPESDLPKVHLGKSIRYRLSAVQSFLNLKETKKVI